MRFVLVIDDNDLGEDPREQIAQQLATAREQVLDGDRSRACVVRSADGSQQPTRTIGGFALTLGETEGQPGWQRTR